MYQGSLHMRLETSVFNVFKIPPAQKSICRKQPLTAPKIARTQSHRFAQMRFESGADMAETAYVKNAMFHDTLRNNRFPTPAVCDPAIA